MDLKLLLKRGALLAAANWPIIAIQVIAETTFQVLLVIPVLGAAILVAVLLGADLAELLQGGLRETFGTVAGALTSEPFAFVAFISAFGVVVLGGSILMFLVKGGIVEVLLTASESVGPIEQEPLTLEGFRAGSRFTLERFTTGCARLFRPYLTVGLMLMLVYAVSAGAYLSFVVFGYFIVGGRALIIGWTFVAALALVVLVIWITVANTLYLLFQIAMAYDGVGLTEAARHVVRFIRAEFRDVANVFLVIIVLVVAATLVSALAWSGVGLIAFVPLVGVAVFPLQIAALVIRGLVFAYLGLTSLGAYMTLYGRYRARHAESFGRAMAPSPAEHPV